MVARRATALVLAAALATGLAGCGGGDDDVATDEVDLEDVESDASSASSEEEEEAGDDAEEEATDDTADDLIEGAFSEGCGEFTTVFGALGAAAAGVFDAEAAEEFETFVDDAPEEISDDLETVAETYQEVAESMEAAGFDPEDPTSFDPSDPEALEILTEMQETLASPEFLEANQAISEFIASGCET